MGLAAVGAQAAVIVIGVVRPDFRDGRAVIGAVVQLVGFENGAPDVLGTNGHAAEHGGNLVLVIGLLHNGDAHGQVVHLLDFLRKGPEVGITLGDHLGGFEGPYHVVRVQVLAVVPVGRFLDVHQEVVVVFPLDGAVSQERLILVGQHVVHVKRFVDQHAGSAAAGPRNRPGVVDVVARGSAPLVAVLGDGLVAGNLQFRKGRRTAEHQAQGKHQYQQFLHGSILLSIFQGMQIPFPGG